MTANPPPLSPNSPASPSQGEPLSDASAHHEQDCETLKRLLREALQELEATRQKLDQAERKIEQLQQQNAQKDEELKAYAETCEKQQQRLDQLEHSMDLLIKQIYGRGQDRFDADQLPLFDEQEILGNSASSAGEGERDSSAQAPEDASSRPSGDASCSGSSGKKRAGHGRRRLPENLERRRTVYEISEAERTCTCCGQMRTLIGEETSEQLEFQPAILFVRVHVRYKYACKQCENHGCSESSQESPSSEPDSSETKPNEAAESETSETVTKQAETSQHETSQHETNRHETSQHETNQRETSQRETSEHETSQHETSQHETSQPETSQRETSQPETNQPETNQHETNQHETSQRDTDEETQTLSTENRSDDAFEAPIHPPDHDPPDDRGSCAASRSQARGSPGSGTGHIIIAPKPPQPIGKGLPGPALLAHVILSKFGDHLPLYRQEDIFMRYGIHLRRSTLCGWVRAGANLAQPLLQRAKVNLFQSRVIQTDDTSIDMLGDKGGNRTARLWPYFGDAEHPQVIYDFTLSRAYAGPIAFLKGYRGYLQGDGYGAYDSAALESEGEIIPVGCWAHCRRYFVEAQKNDTRRAHHAGGYIGLLYRIERELKHVSEEERLKERQQRALPILKEFFAWVETERGLVLPKSAIGEALTYAWNQRQPLMRYTEAGFLKIDNNDDEQMIKPVALGRNNWLFFGSEAGGHWGASMFSLVSTCKRNLVEPQAYLTDLFRRLPTIASGDNAALDALLPHRWLLEHPEHRWEIADIRRREREEAERRRAERRAERRARARQAEAGGGG